MAENRKLDMSLDDIIRMDGIKGPRGFARQNNSEGGGGGPRRRFGGGGQVGGGNRRYEPKRLNNGGPYNRSRNSYGGGGQSSNNRNFGGGDRRRQQNGGGGGGYGGGNRRQATLHVSNLAGSVNSEDIEELFSTFGVLVRSYVHYDQYGTSLSTAEVIFEQRSDATEARNKLNSVPLDGKPLRITMIDEDEGPNDPFSNYLRSSQQRSNNSRSNNNNNNYQNRDRNRTGGGGGGHNNRSNPRTERSANRSGHNGPQKSAEDLDREMDEWRMQMDDGPKNGVDDELF